MEDKKIEEGASKEPKLSYEQLKAYAAQTVKQAEQVFKENQILRKALYEQSLKEVELAIKCLDHADMFSAEFINSIVKRIEEIMNPQKEIEDKSNSEENE